MAGLATGVVAHGIAWAAWTSVDAGAGPDDATHAIDLDRMRQAGPMAIYRQVPELTVYATRQASGLRSILRRAEYDCMSPRVRVLQEAGFTQPDGSGDPVPMPAADRRAGDWVPLAMHPAGEAVWKRVCPGHGER